MLGERRVAEQRASKQELDDLRAIVERDLKDASLGKLSGDSRFNLAYNAARTVATMAIRAEGYRVRGAGGQHFNTFLALEAALGPGSAELSVYLDRCRMKRNQLNYDRALAVSETEVAELIERVAELRDGVEKHISQKHPELS